MAQRAAKRKVDEVLDKLSHATFDSAVTELSRVQELPQSELGMRLCEHSLKKPSFDVHLSVTREIARSLPNTQAQQLLDGFSKQLQQEIHRIEESPLAKVSNGDANGHDKRLAAVVVHAQAYEVSSRSESVHVLLQALLSMNSFNLRGQPGTADLAVIASALTAVQSQFGMLKLKSILFPYLERLRAIAEESYHISSTSASHDLRYRLAVELQSRHDPCNFRSHEQPLL